MLVNQALRDFFIACRVEKMNHRIVGHWRHYLFLKGSGVSRKESHCKISPAGSSEMSLACEWQTWRQLTIYMHNQPLGHTAPPLSVRRAWSLFSMRQPQHLAASTYLHYITKIMAIFQHIFCSSFIQQLNCDNLSHRVRNWNYYYYSVKATGRLMKSPSHFKAPCQLQ